MSTKDNIGLVVGCFYWVRPVRCPDVEEAWMEDEQPARYSGDGLFVFLGSDEKWPASWVGGLNSTTCHDTNREPPSPPNRPLTRNIKEGCGVGICPKCGSTVERKRFFSREKVCIHPECDFSSSGQREK